MIQGIVSLSGRIIVPLTILSPADRPQDARALLDTGFNGDVVLPGSIAQRLGLQRVGGQRNQVADGRWVWMDAYSARILWDGEIRPLVVLVAGDVPLIGTSLLLGLRLVADIHDGGSVTIERLPESVA